MSGINKYGVCKMKDRFHISTNKTHLDKSSARICFLFESVLFIVKENILNHWTVSAEIHL
jgi:hypothetical protein